MDSKACIQQFIKDHQLRYTPETLMSYQRFIERLVAYTCKEIYCISKRDIRFWLYQLGQIGLKANTINSHLIGLKTFFNYCKEEGHIKKNPVEGIPFQKVEDSPPKALTLEQCNALRKQAERKLLDRALIEVLYTTGVRRSEMATMKISDINWSHRSIWIAEGKRKKERIVLFTRECEEHLKAYLNSRTDDLPYVFVNAASTRGIHVQAIRRMFECYSQKLGFKVSPHLLRHTFASHLIRRGMPLNCIQILMGHEHPETTRHYAKLYSYERKEKYDEWM